jgi:glycosyltransferase involved in cell wall biosynthesis
MTRIRLAPLIPFGLRPYLRASAVRLLAPSANAAWATPAQGNVTVAGLFSSPTGLGEGARLCAERLADLNYRVGVVDVTRGASVLGGRDVAHPKIHSDDAGGPLIVHLNPPMFQTELIRKLRGRIGRRKLIGYWVWELPDVPAEWRAAFRLVHEVWVPSHFVADAIIRAGCRAPVRIVPHPLRIPPFASPPRKAHLGLTVLSIFAYDSGFERKNAIAAIEAFRRAFTTEDNAALIVKARGHSRSGEPERRVQAAIAGSANIHLLAGDLLAPEYERLLDSADILLSLHRSEGFGLPLAAAMLRGKPVIATAWSGNLDFMSEDSACLVPALLVPAMDEADAYRHCDSVWASPDIEVAVAWLRRLRNPELREQIGRAAREHVAACLAPDVFAAAALAGLGPP